MPPNPEKFGTRRPLLTATGPKHASQTILIVDLLSPPLVPQVCLDEGIDIPVHHSCSIARLLTGPHVLHLQ